MNVNNLNEKQQELMSLHFDNCFKVGELLRIKKWAAKDFDEDAIVVVKAIDTKEEFLKTAYDMVAFSFANKGALEQERIVTLYNPEKEKFLFITEFSVVTMEFDCFFEKVQTK